MPIKEQSSQNVGITEMPPALKVDKSFAGDGIDINRPTSATPMKGEEKIGPESKITGKHGQILLRDIF